MSLLVDYSPYGRLGAVRSGLLNCSRLRLGICLPPTLHPPKRPMILQFFDLGETQSYYYLRVLGVRPNEYSSCVLCFPRNLSQCDR